MCVPVSGMEVCRTRWTTITGVVPAACLFLCPCVYLCGLCLSMCLSVCVCVCLGWRFAGRGRQLSRVVPAGAAADGPVGPQVDNVRLHDVCLQSRQRARRSHLLSTQNSRSVEFTHLTLALTHTLALYHHHHYHHFMCPIIQQCAHLHQCSLEEQDSKVRQEHYQNAASVEFTVSQLHAACRPANV